MAGMAMDMVLVSATNPGAAGIVGSTVPSGDSLAIRNFQAPDRCYLEGLIRQGATLGFFGVKSPLLHDNNRGIRVTPPESPSVFSLPAEYAQTMQAGDVLVAELSGGAAETDIGLLQLYYTNMPGAGGRLFSRGDVMGNIKTIKPQTVAVVSSATIGQWSDTALLVTENTLHAGADYAVLGYMTNAALGAIAVKGADTGNFRIGGPGAASGVVTTHYFLHMSDETGRPHIPVINQANAVNTVVSVCSSAAGVAATVELILAELVNPLPR